MVVVVAATLTRDHKPTLSYNSSSVFPIPKFNQSNLVKGNQFPSDRCIVGWDMPLSQIKKERLDPSPCRHYIE